MPLQRALFLITLTLALPASRTTLPSPLHAQTAARQSFDRLRADGNGFAALQQQVVVDVTAMPLAYVIRSIQRQADLSLVFGEDLEGLDRPITLRDSTMTAAEALIAVLAATNLEVLVSPSGQAVVAERANGSPSVALTGVITDQATGDPVADAEVRIDAVHRSVLTDRDGRFRLPEIPAGAHTLFVRRPGYVDHAQRIDTGSAGELALALMPRPTPLAEVIVSPGVYGMLDETVASRRTLTRAEIEAAPQIGDDVFRAVERLPGVAGPDMSAAFGVRGSSSSEVSLRLDGIELIEPYHLKDVDAALSIVDHDAIGGIELNTGGFGAQYGDRLAGVFDMRTLDAAPGRPRTTLGLSLTNLRAATTGTFAGGRGSWLGSVRRGYLDLALKLGGSDDPISPIYYDMLGKVEYALSDRFTVSGHVLHGVDRLDYSSDDTDPDLLTEYGSSYAWVTLDGEPASRLTTRSVFSLGRVTWNRLGTRERERFVGAIDIDDSRWYEFAGLRQTADVEIADDVLLRTGLELQARSSSYDYDGVIETWVIEDGDRFTRADTTVARLTPGSTYTAAWLSGRYRPLPGLTFEAGVRWDRHTHTGDSDIGPRFNVAWEVDGRTTVRAAWGRYAQAHGLHELEAEAGEEAFAPSELAEHRILGIERSFPGGIDVRVEAFDRRQSEVRPRWVNLDNDPDFMPEATSPRELIDPASADSRGIEFSTRHRAYRGLDWAITYALSESVQRIDDADVPGQYDQRHAFGADVSWANGSGWRLAAAWQYHTGWPHTPATMAIDTVGGDVYARREWGAYNTERLPSYHRLDIRLSREIPTRRGRLRLLIDVYNVYGRENARAVVPYVAGITNRGTPILNESVTGLLPRLPSFGIQWTF